MPIRTGGFIAAAILALGALLPWAVVSSLFGSISVAGTDGDGVITLVCAIVIGVIFRLWKRPARIVAAVLAAGAALVLGLIGQAAVGRTPAAFRPSAYGPASSGSATYGRTTLYPQAGPATAYPTACQSAGSTSPPASPAAPVAPAPQTAPAGWQPDPYHQAQWRYWDGARWTEHVQ